MRIEGSVVVVTGATSGIGRATALRLCAGGARVVLVARGAEGLAATAAECRGLGGQTLALSADVADAEAVERVAATTVERFGRIDGWVNSAGVEMFGAFLDAPLDEIRRVLDVDLGGCVHGCRSALSRMVPQGHGVVVNLSSILGIVAQPYGAGYTMAKFAVRGLGACLRQELRLAGVRGVDVCTVFPTAIDTPMWQDAANRTGRRVRALPPPLPPERVAAAVVRRLRRPRGETVVGGLLGRALLAQYRLWPGSAEWTIGIGLERWGLSPTKRAPSTAGNLFRPAPGPGAVRGGWRADR
ncbi:SDR family NAD(P)-dependent oxidoreductase [Pseudonocardia lacus]|jgi:NAD(P)-dependent dehydrogenase (short-subunit alcohol dehydrogenase family)|uniref:SDR family NAD(P)-dependent oxidoreductase n=1 Tax=Pseudonocardia lacus TaxID=2835865 RepID=UPI0020278E9A|nr:SDR family NAD(P)-dependent oxidoreductase [Pseudonocardia lacus]